MLWWDATACVPLSLRAGLPPSNEVAVYAQEMIRPKGRLPSPEHQDKQGRNGVQLAGCSSLTSIGRAHPVCP